MWLLGLYVFIVLVKLSICELLAVDNFRDERQTYEKKEKSNILIIPGSERTPPPRKR